MAAVVCSQRPWVETIDAKQLICKEHCDALASSRHPTPPKFMLKKDRAVFLKQQIVFDQSMQTGREVLQQTNDCHWRKATAVPRQHWQLEILHSKLKFKLLFLKNRWPSATVLLRWTVFFWCVQSLGKAGRREGKDTTPRLPEWRGDGEGEVKSSCKLPYQTFWQGKHTLFCIQGQIEIFKLHLKS